MANRPRQPLECPVCGADVPPNAACCPDCGSDDETGWSDDTIYDGVDLPDASWGDEQPAAPSSRFASPALVWAVLILLALLIMLGAW